jgi:DNA-binding CsgD family transcriptional regulator
LTPLGDNICLAFILLWSGGGGPGYSTGMRAFRADGKLAILAEPPLLDREQEMRTADRWLSEAEHGRGSAHGVEGPAGSGKTRLLEVITESASQRGFMVLRAKATALEHQFALGVVRDLFEAWWPSPMPGLEPPAPAAGEAADDAPEEGMGATWRPADLGEAVRDLFGLTARLARRRPLLMAVDDVQWADESSVRVLCYMASRLQGLRASLVLSWRQGEVMPGGAAELTFSARDRVVLSGLSEKATAELLESHAPGSGQLAAACRAATSGMPWLVVGVCRALAEEGPVVADSLTSLLYKSPPEVISANVAQRLGALGGQAISLAEAVAVLGPSTSLRAAAALARLSLAEAAAAGDLLASRDILASSSPLAFAAPLLGSAVYQSISPARRALLHGDAATALMEAGAPPGVVADHVILGEPGGAGPLVPLLLSAAREASVAGDNAGAARYLGHALAEVPSTEPKGGILLDLGRAEARCFASAATGHLAQAMAAGVPGAARARAALELAEVWLLAGRCREAAALLRQELEAIGPDEPALAARVRAEMLISLAAGAEGTGGFCWADELQPAAGGPAAAPATVAASVLGASMHGAPCQGTGPLAEALLGQGAAFMDDVLGAGPALVFFFGLQVGGCAEQTVGALDPALVAARRSGSLAAEAAVLIARGQVLAYRGALAYAEAEARGALALTRAEGAGLFRAMARACLLEVLLDQGRLEDAGAEVTELAPHVGEGSHLGQCLLALGRGRLRAALGDLPGALADLLGAGRRLAGAGWRTPGLPWRSQAALVAHALGRDIEAARLVEEELALATELGAPPPISAALRARALVSGPTHQVQLLVDAVELLRGTPCVLQLALTLCDLGSAYRRAGARNTARARLQEGLQLAHECGAFGLCQRARGELVLLGARPRRHAVTGVDALTARERQVSQLAAEGLTNRQIAMTMSVSAYTIEYHLTNAFRKLGIARRTGLNDLLADAAYCPESLAEG